MRALSVGLAGLLGLFFCGGCGGSDKGEPLIAGQLTGDYEDHAFIPINGFATLYKGGGLIALGDGPIHCGTESSPEPPSGTNAILSVALTVGDHAAVGVQLLQNNGSFHGVGSNSGSVTLTDVNAETVAGTVTWDYTSTTDAKHYHVSGSFTVKHCAP